MIVRSVRIRGLRCFDDTGTIVFNRRINLFVGKNNAGKSTLLQGLTAWQLRPFDFVKDRRPGTIMPTHEIHLDEIDIKRSPIVNIPFADISFLRASYSGGHINCSISETGELRSIGRATWQVLNATWPTNALVPFVAKRKAQAYQHGVSTTAQATFDGSFANLYARIDSVASPGRRSHDIYKHAVESIVGAFVTTRASPGGKEAGYFIDDESFVTLEQMGDGIAEIVALLVELSISKGKIFVLEEPETNLHPESLKALLALIRESATHNQFMIATHSNIVIRELGIEDATIFRVFRDDNDLACASHVEEVTSSPESHREILRELGYEFQDFGLFEGWLFLEEASAETIFRDCLLPIFAPDLAGRLRTFSAAGATNLEPSISEFQRLVTFVHLQPLYKDRLWIRAYGDQAGLEAIKAVNRKFNYLTSPRSACFSKPDFELYYPEQFGKIAQAALSIQDKKERTAAKMSLLKQVVDWSRQSKDAAEEWSKSAREPIDLLKQIQHELQEATAFEKKQA